ncbi:hypothetical protein BDR26DRAFT_914885 [Obelidium mucronatum]|nr:hypothetical protein BDR26DRAFT_914885 [Obelidium mucronatum]
MTRKRPSRDLWKRPNPCDCCKLRRKKCDLARPGCGRCVRLGSACVYSSSSLPVAPRRKCNKLTPSPSGSSEDEQEQDQQDEDGDASVKKDECLAAVKIELEPLQVNQVQSPPCSELAPFDHQRVSSPTSSDFTALPYLFGEELLFFPPETLNCTGQLSPENFMDPTSSFPYETIPIPSPTVLDTLLLTFEQNLLQQIENDFNCLHWL